MPAPGQQRLNEIYSGEIELQPEFLQPVTHREILTRMLNNLRQIYFTQRNFPKGLVVLDLLLPQLDGLHLLNDLRAQRPELPVLILSARSDLATKLRSFELGANDYLSKPFALRDLLDALAPL